jgi:dUTP pyrophosphatase
MSEAQITTIPYTLTDPKAHAPGVTYTDDEYAVMPLERAHDDDAAYDLRSAEEAILFPRERYVLRTGLRLALPVGFAGLVLPRSGLAAKHGITIVNSPGLIDPGYRGEVGVTLWNTGSIHPGDQQSTTSPFNIKPGDRIAQLLIIGVGDFRFEYVTENAFNNLHCNTTRGTGGFGSTGR